MTVEEVQKLSELARLSFTQTELEQFTREFTSIVDYVGTITSANLVGIEPLSSVSGAENITRPDVEGQCLSTEDALQNAPKKNEAFFKVPRVLG